MKSKVQFFLLLLLLASAQAEAQLSKWQKGVLVDEFIFESAPFPESHAATIAEAPSGLIAAWFGGTKERNPDVEIWTSRRVGNKWTAPVSVANGIVNDTLRYACWNPVLYQVPGGDLLLFYKVGPNVGGWKGWMKTSSDDGLTWSAAKPLQEGFLGPVKNKPMMVSNGNIIAPSSTEGNGWKLHFEISEDKGVTWRKVGPINDGKTLTSIQPSILLHKDGKLQVLARSKERALIESWSTDNGETWTPVAKASLPNNNSGTDAVTLKDGRHLLVYNHVYPHDTLKNGKGPRTPLNVAVSKDGKKWFAAAILEDSPISQYSYPSVIQSADGMVHIVYTWRRKKIKYVKLDPSKLKLVEIKNGQWPAVKGYEAPTAGEITKD
ncbi:MAG TPA: sialidase family protein [Flavisolibacter sp.]|nr:sialidase family protein [Flavisolibacter sp.]